MNIPRDLSAALAHAEARSCHRLETTCNVHQCDNQILVLDELLDRRLSGKVHIDVHLFSCCRALCKCVERALVDKCVKALLDQLVTQALCRTLLAAAHIFCHHGSHHARG